MTRSENLLRLQDLVRDVLDDPALRLTEKFSPADHAAWDSVATVQIVLAFEEAFAIRVPSDLVGRLRNVGELLDLLP